MSGDVKNNHQVDLVKRACRGDKAAFHEIINLHKKKVYYIAYDICGDRTEAEDISQEVFIKVFRFIEKFRFDSKFSSWLYQIAVNTSLDSVRKHKDKQVYVENSELDFMDSGEKSPETVTIEELQQLKIRKLLKELSKQEHAAFAMRYYNGFKIMEIAEFMDLSVNTVKTMLFRGKKKLQKRMTELNMEYSSGIHPGTSNE